MTSTSPKKIVIVGGVAAGASAAAKARRFDEGAEIVLLEKGPFVSFANCGLPYHLSGEIERRDDLFVVTPERLKKRYNIDVRCGHEVVEIHRENKRVTVEDLSRGERYEAPYDKLILAPGAAPSAPAIPGIDAAGVFFLKTISDMDGVIAYREALKPDTAAVIGGGFIGLEAAEALNRLGLEVTVVEAADQLLLPWDPDMAGLVEQHMLDALWIEVRKGEAAAAIETEEGRVTGVTLAGGETIDAELIIVATGTVPATSLAADAGLELNAKGLIVTDDHMRTSDPDIFAAGDAVQTIHRISGKPTWVPLAGPANRQGRVAGANAAGGEMRCLGVLGTAVVRVGKMVAARTGLSEREAIEAGFDTFSSISAGKSHADYYPGADDIQLKLILEKASGRLLGGQAVGRSGADKRVDVLATAITAGMTVDDLADLELAYAPPFGCARDPVNVAAMVAGNRMEGRSHSTTWQEVMKEDPRPLFLDVRSPEERKTVYVKNTEHLDIDTLREKLGELDKNAPIRIYCRIGLRGYIAETILRGNGFTDVKSIAGGWRSLYGDLRENILLGQEPEPDM